MTITKNITAPVGAGITRFVAEMAFQHCAPEGRKLIVVAMPEMQEQWRRFLSEAEVQAEFVTLLKFKRLATIDNDALVIFTEHHHGIFRRVAYILQRCAPEVWTINAPELPPL